eukprot:CAMPEP_0206465952 /NCGR_PEP_ID=MMETSP0324_2-20121206/28154_1 /ASSEMBLY_ACC=CAM_ASM_000836 /TAXON_ID=2866 /ORGANISM="Crypthecodinium cohnii, Strain Seligo" /LENGTH=290 /DNA_ID=CAMNT_0053938945 /DNA_START=17 /DNA_END=890 /DNA_ORIENTATION=+
MATYFQNQHFQSSQMHARFVAPPPGLAPLRRTQEEAPVVIPTFGLDSRSDSQLIEEMLSKLSMNRPTAANSCSFSGSIFAKDELNHSNMPYMWKGTQETLSTVAPVYDEGGSSCGQNPSMEELPMWGEVAEPTMVADKPDSPRSGGKRQGMTTLMVRNIPSSYTQEMLVDEWAPTNNFDFLYLPRSGAGQSNLGYAFINFPTEDEALAFKNAWHKKGLADSVSRKIMNISAADIQGLRANLMQLKKKRARCLDARQCHPVIVQDGQRITLADALQNCSRKKGSKKKNNSA